MFRCLLAAFLAMGALSLEAKAQENGEPASKTSGTLHLLAIGVCPPYRKHIPVEVCRNGVNEISNALATALSIDKRNITKLTDERSTATNTLKTLKDLSSRLTKNDRLVVYTLLHGDAFGTWAEFSAKSAEINAINREIPDNEDLMVFWTKDRPTVPALALASKEWITATQYLEAIGNIPAKVSLVLESCSSGLVMHALARAANNHDNIDYVVTSAGPLQASNLDSMLAAPLFALELSTALQTANIKTFGEAVAQARMTTVLRAAAICSSTAYPAQAFEELFQNLDASRAADVPSGMLQAPMWYCTQVPIVVAFSSSMSSLPLAGKANEMDNVSKD